MNTPTLATFENNFALSTASMAQMINYNKSSFLNLQYIFKTTSISVCDNKMYYLGDNKSY